MRKLRNGLSLANITTVICLKHKMGMRANIRFRVTRWDVITNLRAIRSPRKIYPIVVYSISNICGTVDVASGQFC